MSKRLGSRSRELMPTCCKRQTRVQHARAIHLRPDPLPCCSSRICRSLPTECVVWLARNVFQYQTGTEKHRLNRVQSIGLTRLNYFVLHRLN